MKSTVRMRRDGAGICLELAYSQRRVIFSAGDVMCDFQVSNEHLEVLIGAGRPVLKELCSRIDTASPGIVGMTVGIRELHLIYQMVNSFPGMFSSEEPLHVRTGCYSEDYFKIARGILYSLDNLPPREYGD